MNAVLETIAKRSSTRGYKSEPITKEALETIITAGLQAPTARNMQELHFTVIKGDNPAIKAIDNGIKAAIPGAKKDAPLFTYNAPYLIVISGKNDFKWSPVDAGIAVENMHLACEAIGLGSVIIGMIKTAYLSMDKAEADKLLGIPEGYDFQIALALGYKATGKEPHTFVADNQVSYL